MGKKSGRISFIDALELHAGTIIATTITSRINHSLHLVSHLMPVCLCDVFKEPCHCGVDRLAVAMTSRQSGTSSRAQDTMSSTTPVTNTRRNQVGYNRRAARGRLLWAIWRCHTTPLSSAPIRPDYISAFVTLLTDLTAPSWLRFLRQVSHIYLLSFRGLLHFCFRFSGHLKSAIVIRYSFLPLSLQRPGRQQGRGREART